MQDRPVFELEKVQPLPREFFTRTEVPDIAQELLGKLLVTRFDGELTAGIITETEAYRAPDDRASHAYGNRRTPRTEVMFLEGGCAYIYLCYGIHQMFNVVTAPEGMAHAVLVRAVEPVAGIDVMIRRRQGRGKGVALSTGPGALAQAFGLHTRFTGAGLLDRSGDIWLGDPGWKIPRAQIASGARIGVDYAGECANWPWRYWWKQSPYHK